MTTTTRQIILDITCDIYVYQQVTMFPSNTMTFTVKNCKIIRETNDKQIVWETDTEGGHYGFFDRPEQQSGVIDKANISVIVYNQEVKTKQHPSLDHYRKDDKIELQIEDIRKYQVGKATPMTWRKGVVLSTGLSYPNHGERHKPFPYIEYKFIRTYWNGDSDGNGEFYDKESIEREYESDNVRGILA